MQRYLAGADRRRIAVERHSGAVGAAEGELLEHPREQRSEFLVERWRFRVKPGYPTHATEPRQCARSLQWPPRAHFRAQMWWLALLPSGCPGTQLPLGAPHHTECLT